MKNKNLRLIASTLLVAATTATASCAAKKGAATLDPSVSTDGVKLDFWTGFGSVIAQKLEDIVLKDFTAKEKIQVKHVTKGGYDGLQKAINLSASSITYPNIALGYPDHFAGYVASDIQRRLDPFMEIDSEIPNTRDAMKFDLSDYYPSYLTENQTLEYDENGKGYTLGLPFNKSTEEMVYNKTFFNNEWVKSQGVSLPETWDDVATQGKKIITLLTPHFGKMLGTDGKDYASAAEAQKANASIMLNLTNVTADGFFPFSYDSTANLFITGLRQWGATYTYVDQATRMGYVGFDKKHKDSYDKTLDFLTKMRSLANDHIIAIPSSFNGTSLYASAYYVNFQTLCNVGSSAGLTNYAGSGFTSAAGYTSGVSHVPYKSADKKFVISQGTNICILDKGNQAELLASWKAVKYLTGEGNGKFAALTGYFPVCKKAAASADYQKFLTRTADDDGNPLADDELLKQEGAVYNSNNYDADNSDWTKFVDPGFNGSSSIRTEVGNLISEVLLDKTKTVSDILDSYLTRLADYVEA